MATATTVSATRKEECKPILGVMYKAYGPDFTLLGRPRHLVALGQILAVQTQKPYGGEIHLVRFFLTIDGRFAPELFAKPIQDGVRRCTVDRDGLAFVDIGLSLTTVLTEEQEFREALCGLLSIGAARLGTYARRKKLDFDAEGFQLDTERSLDIYRKLPLPLQATSGEIGTANFFGIP